MLQSNGSFGTGNQEVALGFACFRFVSKSAASGPLTDVSIVEIILVNYRVSSREKSVTMNI